tara:strand:+ start:597 stop:773 length:177 start_codon:yes stop_codon:yes gene_type:complete
MNFEFLILLGTVTAINFVVVFGGTFGFLYIRDKIRGNQDDDAKTVVNKFVKGDNKREN